MIYFYLVFFTIFVIINKLAIKKGYDLSQITIWLFITTIFTTIWLCSLLYPGIHYGYGLLIVLILLYFKEVRTPFIFILKSIFTVLNLSNDFKQISKDLFYEHTNFKQNFLELSKDPSIWLLNYPSKNLIEYYTLGLFPDNFIMIVNKKASKILSKAIPKDRIIGIDFNKTSNYENIKSEINNIINVKQLNVLVYFDTKVEYKGFKSQLYSLQTPRTGILSIAKELSIQVTPIVVDHLFLSNGIIHKQNFEIRVCKPILIKNVENDILEIKKIFNKILKNFLIKKFLNKKI